MNCIQNEKLKPLKLNFCLQKVKGAKERAWQVAKFLRHFQIFSFSIEQPYLLLYYKEKVLRIKKVQEMYVQIKKVKKRNCSFICINNGTLLSCSSRERKQSQLNEEMEEIFS